MSTKNKIKTPAASLKRRNNGLGLPIHIKKLPILLNIRYYIILPIYISLLYIHYIKFPIVIRYFPIYTYPEPSIFKSCIIPEPSNFKSVFLELKI